MTWGGDSWPSGSEIKIDRTLQAAPAVTGTWSLSYQVLISIGCKRVLVCKIVLIESDGEGMRVWREESR